MKTDERFEAKSLYDIYNVTLRFRDKVCGGTPKNPDLLKGWIAATTDHDDATTEKQVQEARDALLEPTEEKSWNGFPAVENIGPFIWARQIKALFKECATMLRVTIDKRGSKQIFQHGFEIKGPTREDRVFLFRNQSPVKVADGFDEGPIHVQTAQGPRTALKRVDYIEAATLTFNIWVLATATAETRHIGEKELIRMLTFGQENGLGADRSQGRGKFDVISFEVVQKVTRAEVKEETVEPKTKSKTKASPEPS